MCSTRATEPARRRAPRALWTAFCGLFLAGCGYDSGSRWLPAPVTTVTPVCTLDSRRCAPELEQCVATSDGAQWQPLDDCSARGLICSRTLEACTLCEPNQG